MSLHTLSEDLNGFHISSRSNSDNFGFFSELSPFSNFHPSRFNFNGTNYHSSEQMIQHIKVNHFKNKTVAEEIERRCDTVLECKKLPRNITSYDHENWKKHVKSLCEKGIKAKFMQNLSFLKLLHGTQNVAKIKYGVMASFCMMKTALTGNTGLLKDCWGRS